MNKIKELRAKTGLTIRDLAEQTGINESTISKIEGGHRDLKEEYIRILTKYFNVTTGYLLGIEEFGIKVYDSVKNKVDFLSEKQYSNLYQRGYIDTVAYDRRYSASYNKAFNPVHGCYVEKQPNGEHRVTFTIGSDANSEYVENLSFCVSFLEQISEDFLPDLKNLLFCIVGSPEYGKSLTEYSKFLIKEKNLSILSEINERKAE